MYLESSVAIWVTAICTLLIYICISIRRKYSFWKKKGIDYVKPSFFMGNVELVRTKSFAEKTQDLYKDFPEERYHGGYFFMDPLLVIKDPELIKLITVKDFDHFVDHRNVVNYEADPLWGGNLFTSTGERWRDLRSTLSPSFTSSKMKFMYNLIDECAQDFVGYFKRDNSEVIELEMKDILSRYSNDVIATAAFGLKCNSVEDRNNSFYSMGRDVTNFGRFAIVKLVAFAVAPSLCQLLKIKVIPTRIADYFSKIIEDTVKIRQEQHIVRPDMIHLLLEAKKERQHEGSDGRNTHKEAITIQDIVSQAFVFFLAGFETVSILLSFAMYELALNPVIQDKLRQEILTIRGEITYETLLKIKYLDMVTSETLRKWPPIVNVDRQVTKAYTIQPTRPQEKPLFLEKGLLIWMPAFAIHRDPKWYPEPDKFDPERFSDEKKHKIHPYAYMPFGAGPRNCIGSRFALLETKLIIFHILKDFEVVPVKKTPIPMVLDTRQFNVKAKGGMWLGLKRL